MMRRIIIARGITQADDRKVFFFNHIGAAAYEALEVAMNGDNMDSKSIDEFCTVLTGLFESKGLIAATRHWIFTAKQQSDQNSKQFIQQVQAIIAGLSNRKIKEKLLETTDLTMSKLEEIVDLLEGTQSAASQMAGASGPGTIAMLDRRRNICINTTWS
ncbi:unnamed protein product [Bursaphelenchus xylophilus]|nr:unnamed protein product [Bursaphelenchus xylophilus]CAG9083858.1 unnamed protein product [Bursaphelenchus xylophilus]